MKDEDYDKEFDSLAKGITRLYFKGLVRLILAWSVILIVIDILIRIVGSQ